MSRWLRKSHKKAGQVPGKMVYTGIARRAPVTITLLQYNTEFVQEQVVQSIREATLEADSHSVTWVNVDGIHEPDVVDQVGEHFGLHQLLRSDVVNVHQRPKTEEYDSYIYVTLKMIRWQKDSQTMRDEHVSLILGKNYVLSFQEEAGDVFEWVRDRIRHNKGRIRTLNADYLLYSLLDAVVDGYFITIEKIGDLIEELEEDILDNPSHETMGRLNLLKREMIAIRKAIYPLREAVNTLIKAEHTMIQPETLPYLKDVYDHTIQVYEIIESYRDVLGGLFDLSLSSISNRLNEIMKVLTIFAAIFIPLTFLAGIYGMNFKYMPELHYRYGYYAIWLIMLGIAVGMLLWFKKKRWL